MRITIPDEMKPGLMTQAGAAGYRTVTPFVIAKLCETHQCGIQPMPLPDEEEPGRHYFVNSEYEWMQVFRPSNAPAGYWVHGQQWDDGKFRESDLGEAGDHTTTGWVSLPAPDWPPSGNGAIEVRAGEVSDSQLGEKAKS